MTGYDYIVSFFKIGKVPLLKLLEKGIEAQIVLTELSTLKKKDKNTISTNESPLCKMYASKSIRKVKDLRTYTSEEI